MQNREIKALVKQCFENIYTIVRQDAKKHFKSDKKNGEQWNIARSLVFLGGVAKNPDMYFAPEYTNAAWNKRTREYMKKSSLVQQDIAKYGVDYVAGVVKGSIVEAPFSIVFHKSILAFQDVAFYTFCEKVQDFYYQYIEKTYVDERFIQEYAQKIAKWAKIVQTKNCIARGIKKQVYGSYERYN